MYLIHICTFTLAFALPDGIVTVAEALDYETQPRQYNLNITLCDPYACRSSQNLIIYVTQVDEPPNLQVLQISSVSEAEVRKCCDVVN